MTLCGPTLCCFRTRKTKGAPSLSQSNYMSLILPMSLASLVFLLFRGVKSWLCGSHAKAKLFFNLNSENPCVKWVALEHSLLFLTQFQRECFLVAIALSHVSFLAHTSLHVHLINVMSLAFRNESHNMHKFQMSVFNDH